MKESDGNLITGWREDLKVPKDYFGNRDKFIGMLGRFESMQDRHLDSISAAWHRIELNNTGSFRVIKASQTNITICEDGIRNTLAVDQASVDLTAGETRGWPETKRQDQCRTQRARCKGNNSGGENAADAPQEDVVDSVVCNVRDADKVIYPVCCYDYRSGDDMVGPPERIL